MSRDLLIANGDLSLTADGDIVTLGDTPKLRQDLLKITLTTQGANRYHPWYGIALPMVGKAAHIPSTVKVAMANSLMDSLTNLLLLQREQRTHQQLTPAEIILSVDDITVSQDQVDPRQYNIKYFVTTEAFTELTQDLLFRPF